MALRGLLLYIGTRYGTLTSTSTNRPEIRRIDIVPEDTLEPCDNRIDIDDDDEEEDEALPGDEDDATGDPLDPNNPRFFRRFSSGTAFTWSFSRTSTFVDHQTWLQKVKEFVFPPKEDIDSFIPNYRHLPIISGFFIPFSILLEIPGLTQHWYVRTENNQVIEQRANPVILDVGVSISLACAVVANICLITRFLEKRVKTMTILSIAFLTFHGTLPQRLVGPYFCLFVRMTDLINIVAVTIFGVVHRFNDGFTYGQPFWMTVCSTIASSLTTATLIWDLSRTPEFHKSGRHLHFVVEPQRKHLTDLTGSGLTRKQRTLVIIVMVLFCYTCVGALLNSLIQKLSFIDGLYFTLVSIETIGFGDIVPQTTGSRLFVCVYSTVGFVNIGVAIAMCRETVLEAIEVEYRKRAQRVKERWKEVKKRRRVEARWRRAIEWRLKEMGVPIWIRDESTHGQKANTWTGSVKRVTLGWQNRFGFLSRAMEWAGITHRNPGPPLSTYGPPGMRLNLNALTHTQLEASAAEAGVPLYELLPSDFIPAAEESPVYVEPNSSAPGWIHHPLASHFENVFRPTQARSLTHAKLGGMSALLTRFGVATTHEHATTPDGTSGNGDMNPDGEAAVSGETSKIPSPAKAEVGKGLSRLHFDSAPRRSSDNLVLQTMQDLDTKAFYSKLIVALGLFSVFWTVGDQLVLVSLFLLIMYFSGWFCDFYED